MQNTTRHQDLPATIRRGRAGNPTEEERLFGELEHMRRSLRWRCRQLVDDPAAEIDAAVWQQIAEGVQDPSKIYWNTITHLRRLKRQTIRRRQFEFNTGDESQMSVRAPLDEADIVVDRLAARQTLQTCAPPPSRSAVEWIEHMSRPRGERAPMVASTRVAGARWASRFREHAEAYGCVAV